jgi:hypothetical protein
MGGAKTVAFTAGTRVKVKAPGAVPEWSEWDDDHQRTSNSVKKRLQQMFFRGDRRISALVTFIASESQRIKLRSANRVKVELRDAAGASIVITADALNLVAAA